MIGERENITDETQYGSLVMRPYSIQENDIDAFYDSSDNLIFVLDKTVSANKPNVLLVINPEADKKWDEILSGKYDVDLETIRPKQDNKYQKLDIEYSGLSVYENLISAYNNGDGLDEQINQLNILRDSAARHSAITRLNMANDTITKTNATIVKTKESIVRFRERVKTLKSKLSDMKKEVGKIPTKKSAAKILKTESQIESTNDKLKRAEKRLESAEKRLEIAKVDAELASGLLNQPAQEIKQIVKNKPVVVAPRYEVQEMSHPENTKDDSDDVFDDLDDIDDDSVDMNEQETDVKPLFDEDPKIINDNIAFKPISFDVPNLPVAEPEREPVPEPVFDTPAVDFNMTPELKEDVSESVRPVLESMIPVEKEPFVPEYKETNENIEKSDPVIPNFETPKLDMDAFSAPQEPMVADMAIDVHQDVSETPVAPMPQPVENMVRPVSPISHSEANAPVAQVTEKIEYKDKASKSTLSYYLSLLILIALSVFALWTYQKNIGDKKATLAVVAPEIVVEEPEQQIIQDESTDVVAEPVGVSDVEVPADQELFVDESVAESDETDAEPVVPEENNEISEEPVEEPVIVNDVSSKVSALTIPVDAEEFPEEKPVISPQPVVNKPVYGAGSRYDEMFVYEEDQFPEDTVVVEDVVSDGPVIYRPESQYVSQPEYQPEQFVDESYVNQPESFEAVAYSTDVDMQNVDAEMIQDEAEYGLVYPDDVFYDENYDPEEAAYQAGDDGYPEY